VLILKNNGEASLKSKGYGLSPSHGEDMGLIHLGLPNKICEHGKKYCDRLAYNIISKRLSTQPNVF
jgi:hypothetical protein